MVIGSVNCGEATGDAPFLGGFQLFVLGSVWWKLRILPLLPYITRG